MAKYVESHEQLVVEIYVRSVRQAAGFYEGFGFRALRAEKGFVELGWEESRLFLEEIPDQPEPPERTPANIRIMVPDVDRYWELARSMGLRVINPIADRAYGLRDFTVVSPDGIGLRFATRLVRTP